MPFGQAHKDIAIRAGVEAPQESQDVPLKQVTHIELQAIEQFPGAVLDE